MSINHEQIQALKAAAEYATPGEWCADDYYGVIADSGLNGNFYIAICSGPEHLQNKRFIAAANPAVILSLLAERDADKALIAELTQQLQREQDYALSSDLERMEMHKQMEARTLTVKLPDYRRAYKEAFASEIEHHVRVELEKLAAAAGITLVVGE